jgi:uncharacterized damage-inducible protein DinB
MAVNREELITMNLHPSEPEIGYALFTIEDSRRRTLEVLEGLPDDRLVWQAPHHDHTISTLLYHIAAIELDWLVVEVREGDAPPGTWERFPYEVRDDEGRLTTVTGVALEAHLARLQFVRDLLLHTYQAMTLSDFHRPRMLETYDVTPSWVLHHLCQHEAEHRMEMRLICSAAGA